MSATTNKIEVVTKLLLSMRDHVCSDQFDAALGNVELSIKMLENIRREIFWAARNSGEGPK